MAQFFRFLSPMSDTQVEFQNSGLGPVQPWLLIWRVSKSVDGRDLCPSNEQLVEYRANYLSPLTFYIIHVVQNEFYIPCTINSQLDSNILDGYKDTKD